MNEPHRCPVISVPLSPSAGRPQQPDHPLGSEHVDEESSPMVRLMLIVIGVVYYQTPNMLALASLWEISH